MSPQPGTSTDAGTSPGPAHADTGGERGRCVVVGYDGSPEARHAVQWAARRLAGGGRLVLVNACRPRRGSIAEAVLSTGGERRGRAGALLDELLMDMDGLLDVELESSVLDEEPATALIGAAAQHGAGEIVIGSHRRSRLDAVSGDVAAKLARNSPVPVCVVPIGGEPLAHEQRTVAPG